ncbi:hypothetical protein CVT26_008722 [Gymnopilus dilepis]|uniref:Uncharacterized protein n=1 Tax=Gymnopilus dilepis TaxID=231916 RepID=A0A409YG85_9AGAR|nr:hypothetical protein CVT26_008722 [Gymnopilus dilepis]
MTNVAISNWARLATTLIYFGESQAAVESARKAGNTQVWKQVHAACIEKGEFRLAQLCGLHIIVHAEELPALIQQYDKRGHSHSTSKSNLPCLPISLLSLSLVSTTIALSPPSTKFITAPTSSLYNMFFGFHGEATELILTTKLISLSSQRNVQRLAH